MAFKANSDVATTLEEINSRKLDETEQYDIELWQRGRALAHCVNSQGWEVVIDLLRGYADKEAVRLISIDPGDREAVLAAHAVAYAAGRIYTIFVEDVANLVQRSQAVPTVVREGLKSPVPPESL